MNYHEISNVEECNYRKSGLLLAGILALIYVVLFLRGNHQPFVLIAATIISISAWFEAWLLWKIIDLLIRIGNIMHSFTNPVVLGLVYFAAVIPTALFLKLFGKDNLGLHYDRKSLTYWVARSSIEWKDSFRNQF